LDSNLDKWKAFLLPRYSIEKVREILKTSKEVEKT
jgi:hypothetical protein